MDHISISNERQNPPAELMGSTPRSVRITGTGWLNLFAAALFFGLGVAGAVLVVKQAVNGEAARNALRNHGDETLGQVTDVWTSRRRITYSFSADGIGFTGKSYDVPTDNSASLHDGDSLPIRYLPENPNINHPAAWEGSPYSTLWGLSIPATLMFMGSMLVRRFPVQRKLALNGIAVRGSIAKSEWNGPSRGQRYANYTFKNVSTGEVEIGRCPNDSIYSTDSTCWVLYLPTNPKRSEI